MGPDLLQESGPANTAYLVEKGEKPEEEPEQAQDKSKKLDEINLAARREDPRPIFISASLSKKIREQVVQLLKEFKDVFEWTYAQMSGLDPQLVTHKLNIREGCKPIKQARGTSDQN